VVSAAQRPSFDKLPAFAQGYGGQAGCMGSNSFEWLGYARSLLALKNVIEAQEKSMSMLAKKTKLNRENLY